MPDRRRHRGAHPSDAALFSSAAIERMRSAVEEYSWLLSRGYSETSALKLVGDRYSLAARQRTAVARCSCSDQQQRVRAGKVCRTHDLRGRAVALDGFNVLIILESALSGGVVLTGRDRCPRDLASVHGSYRSVEETEGAIELVGQLLERCGVVSATWQLDRPVSNSGRLKARLLATAERRGWTWQVELAQNPDKVLAASDAVVATSDSWILDHCDSWVDLCGAIVRAEAPQAWRVDLGTN